MQKLDLLLNKVQSTLLAHVMTDSRTSCKGSGITGGAIGLLTPRCSFSLSFSRSLSFSFSFSSSLSACVIIRHVTNRPSIEPSFFFFEFRRLTYNFMVFYCHLLDWSVIRQYRFELITFRLKEKSDVKTLNVFSEIVPMFSVILVLFCGCCIAVIRVRSWCCVHGPWTHAIAAKFHLTVCVSQIYQTSLCFSRFFQFRWACAHCSISLLLLADRSGTWHGLCCSHLSQSLMCIVRCVSALYNYTEWLSELPYAFFQLKTIWPFSIDLSHHQDVSICRTATHYGFFFLWLLHHSE